MTEWDIPETLLQHNLWRVEAPTPEQARNKLLDYLRGDGDDLVDPYEGVACLEFHCVDRFRLGDPVEVNKSTPPPAKYEDWDWTEMADVVKET